VAGRTTDGRVKNSIPPVVTGYLLEDVEEESPSGNWLTWVHVEKMPIKWR